MGSKSEIGKVEYHYGFYGAMHAEYEPYQIHMEYLQEHELGSEPVRMDMLLLKLEDTPLQDPIGRFFRKYNVIEYKSPRDGLTISDFYKAQGYALLYKGLEKPPDSIPVRELTVSIFRHAYPREMFRKLKEEGMEIKESHPGIYYISGALSIPAQVVVISRLPAGEYSTFKALGKGASKEDILKVLGLVDESHPGMINYVKAVMNVCHAINGDTISEIKEAGTMTKAFRELFKDELLQERNEGRQEGHREGLQEGLQEGHREGLQEGHREGLQEGRQEVYDRMRAANIPEEEARVLAFG